MTDVWKLSEKTEGNNIFRFVKKHILPLKNNNLLYFSIIINGFQVTEFDGNFQINLFK